jgi:DNA-binding MarR family transcriptional regulator
MAAQPSPAATYQRRARARLSSLADPGAATAVLAAYELRRAGARMAEEIDGVCARHDLTQAGFRVMFLVSVLGASTQVQLSRVSRVSEASMSSAIGTLEQRGLVVRNRDLADRRQLTVSLTSSGASLIETVSQDYVTRLGDVLSALGAPDRVELLRILDRLHRVWPDHA